MRAWQPTDLDAYAAWMADPEVARFVGGVQDAEQAWRRLAMHLGHWQLRGYGTWAVERKADGELLGRAGLFNPEGWLGLEIGWTFKRAAWGHGYAQETARAALQWTWDNLDTPRLISIIDPLNVASIKVARRLGMRFDREDTLHGSRVLIYAIGRPA